MAGRGTDIKLSREVEQLGGLHVILTQHYDAGRIDRQLAGRCARMGDNGSYQQILSLTHIDGRYSDLQWLARAATPLLRTGHSMFMRLASYLLLLEQRRTEKYHARVRDAVFKQDERQRDLLAVSGRSE